MPGKKRILGIVMSYGYVGTRFDTATGENILYGKVSGCVRLGIRRSLAQPAPEPILLLVRLFIEQYENGGIVVSKQGQARLFSDNPSTGGAHTLLSVDADSLRGYWASKTEDAIGADRVH
jgi:hypothetical protein